MPKFCVANGCTNRSNKDECRKKNISYHSFPLKDPIRLKEWLSELKRENFVPNKHSLLCSEHFNDEEFANTISSKGSRKLRKDAVPTKFSFSRPFGKRKRISYQLFKLPETIFQQHAPDKTQPRTIGLNHASQETEQEVAVKHLATEENHSETVAEHHALEERNPETVIEHHVSQEIESQQESVVEHHTPEESHPEAVVEHHAFQESQRETIVRDVPHENQSEAIIEHHVFQESLASFGSERNIHFEALSRDLSKLLCDSSSCDVLLSCQGKTFPAHKIILMMRSQVFSTILDSQMAKSKNILIKIEGFSASTFRGFLQYLYTGEVPEMNQETAKQFFKIAHLYAVTELQKACSDFLVKNVSQATVCNTLLFAIQCKDEDFKNKVISCIVDKKIPECDSGWPEFCKKHPVLANEVMLLYIQKNRSNSAA